MKAKLFIGALIVGILMAPGCTDRKAETRKVREEKEAKARADSARKEMDALPKAFQTPDYFKKNEPGKKTAPATEKKNP